MTQPTPILVELTEPEMYVARQGANLRYQLARLSGLVAKTRDDRTPQELEYLGVCAEMAVSKIFQVDYDPRLMGFDAGVDIWLGNIGIDVKATFHQHGKLLFTSADAFRAPVAVLVTATDQPNVLRVVGCISKKVYLERCVEFDIGKGKSLSVSQAELSDLSQLWSASVKDRLNVQKGGLNDPR